MGFPLIPVIMTSKIYENFELYNPTISIEMLIWSIGAGVGLGAVAAYLRRDVMGKAARILLKREADTPEKALTLAEMGCEKNILIRLGLREEGSLRREIVCANADDFQPRTPGKFRAVLRKIFSRDPELPAKLDFATARFYLPEANKFRAEERYNAKGQTLPRLILALGLIALVCAGAVFVIPELMQMLDNFITIVR